eukprot:Partr_v1_DN29021_c0_g1_i2_m58795 putative NA
MHLLIIVILSIKRLHFKIQFLKALILLAKAFTSLAAAADAYKEQDEGKELLNMRFKHKKTLEILQAEKAELELRKDIMILKSSISDAVPLEFNLLIDHILLSPKALFFGCSVEVAFGLLSSRQTPTPDIRIALPIDYITVRDGIYVKISHVAPLRVFRNTHSRLLLELHIAKGSRKDSYWSFIDIKLDEGPTVSGTKNLPFYLPPIKFTMASLDTLNMTTLPNSGIAICIFPSDQSITLTENFAQAYNDLHDLVPQKLLHSGEGNPSVSPLFNLGSTSFGVSQSSLPPQRSDNDANGMNVWKPDSASVKTSTPAKLGSNLDALKSLSDFNPQRVPEVSLDWRGSGYLPSDNDEGARQAVESADASIRLTVINIYNLDAKCSTITMEVHDRKSVRNIPDLAIRLDPVTTLFENSPIVEFRAAQYSQLFVKIELLDERRSVLAWTRLYLFDIGNATPPDLHEGSRELSLFEAPADGDMKELGDAFIHIQVDDVERALEHNDFPKGIWIANKGLSDIPKVETLNRFAVFIDGARFIPRDFVFVKVHAQLFGSDLMPLESLPKMVTKFNLKSKCSSPDFFTSCEFNSTGVNPSATILFKILGWRNAKRDKIVNVGFSLLNLFVKANDTDQPDIDYQETARLNIGSFQLPIYSGRVNVRHDLTVTSAARYRRIPCATLLIRILPNLGIVGYRPSYANGQYDSSRCVPTECEAKIYKGLSNDSSELICDAVAKIANIPAHDEDAAEQWLLKEFEVDTKAFPLKNLTPILVCPYRPECGLKVKLHAGQNFGGAINFGIISVSPPGGVVDAHGTQGNMLSQFQIEASIAEDSELKSPTFSGPFLTFNVAASSSSLAIIDIRSYNASTCKIEPYGWTALPIFYSNVYALHATMQLPLFAGTPTRPMLQELKTRTPRPAFWSMADEGQIAPISGASVFVSVCDGRRETEIQFTREAADQRLLRKPERYAKTSLSELLASKISHRKGKSSLAHMINEAVRNGGLVT